MSARCPVCPRAETCCASSLRKLPSPPARRLTAMRRSAVFVVAATPAKNGNNQSQQESSRSLPSRSPQMRVVPLAQAASTRTDDPGSSGGRPLRKGLEPRSRGALFFSHPPRSDVTLCRFGGDVSHVAATLADRPKVARLPERPDLIYCVAALASQPTALRSWR